MKQRKKHRARAGAATLLAALVAGLLGCADEDPTVSIRPIATPEGAVNLQRQSPDALVPFIKPAAERSNALAVFYHAMDRSVVPAVIEALRFGQFGVIDPLTPEEITTLRRMTGQHIPADDWNSWVEWWWTQDQAPHPGFAQLKRYYYSRLNQRFSIFLDPTKPMAIDLEEIHLRDPKKVEIRAMIDPKSVARDSIDAQYLPASDLIVGLEVDGERRAYPRRMLSVHEVVNDTLGGRSILLSFNPMTATAHAYEVLTDGQPPPKFGYSGLMYRSAGLLFDDGEDVNLWWSRTGEPVVGPLSRGKGGVRLRPIPATHSSWYVWGATYPDTTVLTIDTSRPFEYELEDLYIDYHLSPEVGMPLRRHDMRLAPKTRLFGLTIGGESVAYPQAEVNRLAYVYDIIAGERVLILTSPRRDEYRAYRVGDRNLFPTAAPQLLRERETGSIWKVTEEALVLGSTHSAGHALERIPGEVTYWFAWQNWHPNTRIYQGPQTRKALAEGRAGAAPPGGPPTPREP